MTVWQGPIQFQWDAGNNNKNWGKHQVTNVEGEEGFFDPHKRLFPTTPHEGREVRRLLIGRTQRERLLFVVFTIRGHAVRVISARDVNKRERGLYEESA